MPKSNVICFTSHKLAGSVKSRMEAFGKPAGKWSNTAALRSALRALGGGKTPPDVAISCIKKTLETWMVSDDPQVL